ncbi:hypothetical protein C8T65DRAFT_51028 [Cerioporus squamosus]|nr:hypothetical protein C8T65DRAFT_51028 [Cerioporus squamosus]
MWVFLHRRSSRSRPSTSLQVQTASLDLPLHGQLSPRVQLPPPVFYPGLRRRDGSPKFASYRPRTRAILAEEYQLLAEDFQQVLRVCPDHPVVRRLTLRAASSPTRLPDDCRQRWNRMQRMLPLLGVRQRINTLGCTCSLDASTSARSRYVRAAGTTYQDVDVTELEVGEPCQVQHSAYTRRRLLRARILPEARSQNAQASQIVPEQP